MKTGKRRTTLPAALPTGRPAEGKGPLRNFRFNAELDTFLADEKRRTNHDKTFVVEAALRYLQGLKPENRDEIISALIRERAQA